MLSRDNQEKVIAAIEAADPATPKARLYDELFPADSRTPTRGEFEELWQEARRRVAEKAVSTDAKRRKS